MAGTRVCVGEVASADQAFVIVGPARQVPAGAWALPEGVTHPGRLSPVSWDRSVNHLRRVGVIRHPRTVDHQIDDWLARVGGTASVQGAVNVLGYRLAPTDVLRVRDVATGAFPRQG